MFSNYTNGTQVTQDDNCGCHSQTPPIIGPASTVTAQKDDYGNIIELQWTPNDRFTLDITSDTWTPIFDGSKILKTPGAVPDDAIGHANMYAYNLHDYKCWQHDGTVWVEKDFIETPVKSSTVVLFSMVDSSTRVCIKNFRGETIHSVENESNVAHLEVDDALAQLLLQGYYTIDIYQITNTSVRYVRRLSVSIGCYEPKSETIIIPDDCCHEREEYVNFSTDDTLKLENNVLSVNLQNRCIARTNLPVSSDAVIDYSQPKNLLIDIDVTTNADVMTSPYPSKAIYEFVTVQSKDVYCYFDGLYIPFVYGDENVVRFSSVVVQDNSLKAITIEIDAQGYVTDKSLWFDARVDYDHIESSLTELKTMHIEHKETTDERLTSLEELVDSIEYTKATDDGDGIVTLYPSPMSSFLDVKDAVLYTEQNLNKEQQSQARKNIGLDFSNYQNELLYVDGNGNIATLALGKGLKIVNGVLTLTVNVDDDVTEEIPIGVLVDKNGCVIKDKNGVYLKPKKEDGDTSNEPDAGDTEEIENLLLTFDGEVLVDAEGKYIQYAEEI